MPEPWTTEPFEPTRQVATDSMGFPKSAIRGAASAEAGPAFRCRLKGAPESGLLSLILDPMRLGTLFSCSSTRGPHFLAPGGRGRGG